MWKHFMKHLYKTDTTNYITTSSINPENFSVFHCQNNFFSYFCSAILQGSLAQLV